MANDLLTKLREVYKDLALEKETLSELAELISKAIFEMDSSLLWFPHNDLIIVLVEFKSDGLDSEEQYNKKINWAIQNGLSNSNKKVIQSLMEDNARLENILLTFEKSCMHFFGTTECPGYGNEKSVNGIQFFRKEDDLAVITTLPAIKDLNGNYMVFTK